MKKKLSLFLASFLCLGIGRASADIVGTAAICGTHTTTTLSATGSGTWSSTNPGVATVNSSGVVTGVSTGTTIISYGSFGRTVYVNTATIGVTSGFGTPFICSGGNYPTPGGTTSLSGAPSGGTWTSSDPSLIAVSSPGGLISKATTATASGTATITYTPPASYGGGCPATTIIATLNVMVPITVPTSFLCQGQTETLSYSGTGGGLPGAWIVNNPTYGTVDAGGVLTAKSAPNVIVYYQYSDGTSTCKSLGTTITIQDTPVVTPPPSILCLGGTATLTGSSGWSSANNSIADFHTATNHNVVTGNAVGTTTLLYGTTCPSHFPVTVVGPVSAITGGSGGVCVGSSVLLSNSNVGGTWTSSNTSVATVNSTTGLVTGVSAGTAKISYSGVGAGSGCAGTTVTTNITVYALPAAVTVTGGGTYCTSTTITASNGGDGTIYFQGTTSFGTSTADASTTKTITTSGTYYFRARSASGCWGPQGSVTVIINPTPAPITGPTFVAVGGTITLSDATSGGTWSGSGGGIVSVDPSTGVVTGLAAGTATVSYTITTDCGSSSIVITVTVSESCLTNSLVINTGYDPLTGSAIAGLDSDGDNNPVYNDPKWVVTSLSTDAVDKITAMGFTPVSVGNPAKIIDGNLPVYLDAWAHGSNSSWITAQNAHGYNTSPANKNFVMKLARTFTTCITDDIVLDINIAADNSLDSLVGIYLDATLIPVPTNLNDQTADNFSTSHVTALSTTVSGLSFGTHTITVAVRNYDFPDGGYNPTGLNIWGTVHSSTGVFSIVSETGPCVSYTCADSGGRAANSNTASVETGSLIELYPNPNNGDFVLKGKLAGITGIEHASISVTDVTGRSVFVTETTLNDGVANQSISLGRNVPNGTYILKMTTGKTTYQTRFTISK